MDMAMMNVRQMRMFMFHCLMRMHMRMREAARSHVGVIMVVMPIIVTMPVFVRHRFMPVLVDMFFGQQEHHGSHHQDERTAKH